MQRKGKIVSVAAMVGTAAVLAAGSATAVEPIQWQNCAELFNLGDGADETLGNMQCSTVEVPMDYDNPDGPTTTVAVSKVPARSGESKSAVFGNPGGPGADALLFWANTEQSPGADPMYDDSDLIAVQPRGLWGSDPVMCDPSKVGALSLNRVHDACFGTDADYISTMTTENAARDMDTVRQAMGLDTLDYYGVSYGTKLGADYATLYPEHTGQMVLDSNVYPDGKWSEMSERTTLAQHARIYDMFDWIAANDAEYGLGDTPLKVYLNWKNIADQEVGGTPNLVPPPAQAGDLPKELRDTPVEKPALGAANAVAPALVRAEGAWNALTLRDLTNNAASGVVSATVGGTANEQSWPMLANTLAYYHNGGKIPRVSPVAAQQIRNAQNSDGHQLNTEADMFTIVTCNEDATTQDPLGIAAARIDGATGGDRLLAKAAGQGAGSDCLGYAPVAKPIQPSGEGLAKKPLIIQNENDVITPIEGAEEMQRVMGGQLTLIPNGGHGAFRTGNRFIDEAVSNFFTAGALPAEHLQGRDAPKPLPKDLSEKYPSNLVGYDKGDNSILSALASHPTAAAAAQAGGENAATANESGQGQDEAAKVESADSGAQNGAQGGAQNGTQNGAQGGTQATKPAVQNPAQQVGDVARGAADAVDRAASDLTGTQQSGARYNVDQVLGAK
ncbi:alpha/beta hydrolase [Dietzia sp.]|uniref:alpha/beta hydrolase n=1 Tax=Dietzia sp. TaxID=1871616 RepID=UPI002FD9B6C0